MGYGTFYKCKINFSKNQINLNDFSYSEKLKRIYDEIIAAVAGGPSMIKTENEKGKCDAEICADFIDKKISELSRLVSYHIIKSQILDLSPKEIKISESDSNLCEAIIDGYINDIDKNHIDYEIDSNERIIRMNTSELIAALAMPVSEQKDDYGNSLSWPKWCEFFVREKLDSIKEYVEELTLYNQCKCAMKDFPESVKSC